MTSERVLEASGDPGEMVKQARLLGQATAQLIQSIKVKYTVLTLAIHRYI